MAGGNATGRPPVMGPQPAGLQPAPQGGGAAAIQMTAGSAASMSLSASLRMKWLLRELRRGRGAGPGRPAVGWSIPSWSWVRRDRLDAGGSASASLSGCPSLKWANDSTASARKKAQPHKPRRLHNLHTCLEVLQVDRGGCQIWVFSCPGWHGHGLAWPCPPSGATHGHEDMSHATRTVAIVGNSGAASRDSSGFQTALLVRTGAATIRRPWDTLSQPGDTRRAARLTTRFGSCQYSFSLRARRG